MEKNTAWAIGLSSVVLIGFFFLQTYFMPKPQPVTQKNETTAVEAAAENADLHARWGSTNASKSRNACSRVLLTSRTSNLSASAISVSAFANRF